MPPGRDDNHLPTYRLAICVMCASDAAVLFSRALAALGRHGEQGSRPLVDAAVVTYARPFTNNYGVGRIEPPGLSTEQSALHSQIIGQRNQAVGHNDAAGIGVELVERAGKWEPNYVAVQGTRKHNLRTMYGDPTGLADASTLAETLRTAWDADLQTAIRLMMPPLDGADRFTLLVAADGIEVQA